MFGLFGLISRLIGRSSNRGKASASRARSVRAARGRIAASQVSEELIEAALEALQEAEDIILDAYIEAITTMINMVGNVGQATVMESRVIPAFEETFGNSDPETGWEPVDIGEYMAFMGEIVEEGNSIMEVAYNDAAGLLDEAAEILL